ncbi:StbB family protein [Vibrio scophthalmi]|uniref:Uncharacterized protein n=1 Tax=Vibrio scophthalmi LMG 19158 TaxID=870967 RepID=F9RI97_9VIBR|nr:StbB family protein [Vibrio scophthalmi]EGU42429.1 hypothetical protein VIS19158_11548 [Vibrio scophthalmi LMG 19158]
MKLAIVNNSGNVGKSTICQVLLQPRLTDSQIIKVETINSDGTDDLKFSAGEFHSIIQETDLYDHAILDVGSSNIETFIHQMKEFKGSHDDIDYFIIPITPKHKQQIDSVSTVTTLGTLGVEPEKIRFIFNQADKIIPTDRQYSFFIKSIKEELDLIVNHANTPTIYETSAFSLLSQQGRTFSEVTNDNRDFKAMLRESTDRDERLEISELRTTKQLINGVNDILDAAFLNLNLGS